MERLSDYDYDLPEDRIAQAPLADRAASKLLHLDIATGAIADLRFRDVLTVLKPGDLLIRNNTRVTARRLFGRKVSGGAVEALLLKSRDTVCFEALLKPAKRLKKGTPIEFEAGIRAHVDAELDDGLRVLRFEEPPAIAEVGSVPLPPYIHELLKDQERYQTVYASNGGSAAAPTAGLHFTDELLSQLGQCGVDIAEVTLDVSLDTFRPIQVENLNDHKMHGETCRVSSETVIKIGKCRGRIIAVGTTTVRTLESFATGKRQIQSGEMMSKLFIRPGFQFQIIDGMFTNFHMPKTSMLMMISALGGRQNIMRAYSHAVKNQYRFLSFGDSMLLL